MWSVATWMCWLRSKEGIGFGAKKIKLLDIVAIGQVSERFNAWKHDLHLTSD